MVYDFPLFQKRSPYGFTLVELLVVIAIIAVLSAILFPVFNQAKQAAKRTVCLSDMKQIVTSQLLYLADSDGAFEQMNPGGCEGLSGFVGRPSTWAENLLSYGVSPASFLCPMGQATDPITTLDYTTPTPVFPTITIGMNSYLGLYYNYYQYFIQDQCDGPTTPGGGPGEPAAVPRTESVMKYPANTALFADGYELPPSWGGFESAWWIDPGYAVGSPFALSDRHGLRTNLAFGDGHARCLVTDSVQSQTAIDNLNPNYVEQANYNAANVIWDIDAANPFDEPNKWPTWCCN
jgi:prepilin-type N-terminal cleavage/methylation domain-containing protein/prepilin-type processing-associated H-X9-DG protein